MLVWGNNGYFTDEKTENKKIKKFAHNHDEIVTTSKQIITEHLLCARTILGFRDTVANKTVYLDCVEVSCAVLPNGDRRK